jgi:hypothetical protein
MAISAACSPSGSGIFTLPDTPVHRQRHQARRPQHPPDGTLRGGHRGPPTSSKANSHASKRGPFGAIPPPTPAQTNGWHSPSIGELGILSGIGNPGGS